MLLKTPFVFFDFEELLIFFYLDYLAVMGLFVCIGHYGSKLLRRIGKYRKQATARIERWPVDFQPGGIERGV